MPSNVCLEAQRKTRIDMLSRKAVFLSLKQYAFFVRCLRLMDDLLTPHPLEAEKPYRIIEEVKVSHID